jgi:tripartite-type tricarboxylate transporter receptor subunit TctC
MNRFVSICAVIAAVGLYTSGPASAEYSFAGKTITYIVATSAGGGFDGYGRLTARYMEKYLPGSTIVVVNRPGAGHIIGTNLIYAARPNGLTIGTFNTGIMYSQLMGWKSVRFDLSKFSWIGKATAEKRSFLVSAITPFKTFEDLRQAKEPVPIAMSGVGSSSYTELRLLAKVFDLKVKMLFGYSGTDDEMAMMRGEVAGKMGTFTGRFILQIGGTKEPGWGEMSFGQDIAKTPEQKAVIKLIGTTAENYRITAGPPAIPADRLASLRAAYRKAYEDPELRAEAAKRKWSINPAFGEEVARSIIDGLDQPPVITAMLRELQNSKPSSMTASAVLTAVKNGGRAVFFKDQSGAEVSARISGSRTRIQIKGKGARRGNLKPGMSCAITYIGPGTEASLVACK